MKNQRQRSNTEPKRGETETASAARGTWTRPDFTEVLVCAEIGAYAFRAN